MLPILSYRLVIAVPFALLIFALFYFPAWKDPALPSSSTAIELIQEVKEVDREAYKKNEVEQSIAADRLKSAKELETSLDGLMNVPIKYFGDYKHVFVAQARVYREKKDRNPEFVARLDAFARKGDRSITLPIGMIRDVFWRAVVRANLFCLFSR